LRPPLESAQYTSFRYTQRLADLGIAASVGSVADAYDNAMAESFVGTLKTELIAGRVFSTRFDAEIAVVEYLGWFNHTRLHEALGDLPPSEHEALCAPPNETITSTIMSKKTN
jgi:putative transposase